MLLYHGSYVRVEKPILMHQERGLDFGAGLYLTSSKHQAERFSHNVVRRVGNGTATVSVFEIDLDSIEQSLRVLRFRGADKDWLDFVKDNRIKSYRGTGYDLVIGPVANDDVLPIIQLYINGQLDADLAIGALKTRNLADQFCFKSEKALFYLKFHSSEEIG